MPPARYQRVYLDSSVYIAAINGEDGRAEIVRQILNAAQTQQISVIASTFLVAEVIKIKGEESPIPIETEADIDAVLLSERLLMVELDLTLALEARKLAREHGLRPGDAIHLATAIRHKAEVVLRYDDRFKSRTEIAGLEICDPYWWGDAPLPGLEKGNV